MDALDAHGRVEKILPAADTRQFGGMRLGRRWAYRVAGIARSDVEAARSGAGGDFSAR
jgi:hypothetical protein